MKHTAVFAAILFLFAGAAYAKEFNLKKASGIYEVEARIDNDPPVVGSNNISIEIRDKSGKYVTNARVVVECSMPAMPGMPAMHYKEPAALNGNTYKAVINFPMAGTWNVEVKIRKNENTEKDGKIKTVKFNVDAH